MIDFSEIIELTTAVYPISNEPIQTGTGEAPHSVGAISISVTVISISSTLTSIYLKVQTSNYLQTLSFFLPLHFIPSPMYPSLQAQVKLPTVLVQSALVSQLLSASEAHLSKLPVVKKCSSCHSYSGGMR